MSLSSFWSFLLFCVLSFEHDFQQSAFLYNSTFTVSYCSKSFLKYTCKIRIDCFFWKCAQCRHVDYNYPLVFLFNLFKCLTAFSPSVFTSLWKERKMKWILGLRRKWVPNKIASLWKPTRWITTLWLIRSWILCMVDTSWILYKGFSYILY